MSDSAKVEPYPEHVKLSRVVEKSQAIGEFLEWAETVGYYFCQYNSRSDEYFPRGESIERILARHFDIDLRKIEEEKRNMISDLRRMHGVAREAAALARGESVESPT